MSETVIPSPIIAYLPPTIGLMGFDFHTPIVVVVQVAIGGGFLWIAQYLSQHIKVKALRWPFLGLAYVFFASAAFNIVWNMLGPIGPWLVKLFRYGTT